MTLQEEIFAASTSAESKTIVFIRASSTARIPVYAHLRGLGYSLVMVHPVPLSEFQPYFLHWIECETSDVGVLESTLRTAAKALGFRADAIISFDEFGVYPAAVVAQRFQLQAFPLSPSRIQCTSVKSSFRDWCYKHGINAPRSATLKTPDADLSALANLEFPVVVKPSPGAGSMLCRRCATPQDVQNVVPHMWTELRSHPSLTHLEALGTTAHLLVEEYIGGQEVDIDCVIDHGRVRFCAISDNFEVSPPYFCEQGGLTPTALPQHPQEALRALLDSFVASHGTELTGVLHFEAKYDFKREKAFVIEVNLRPGSAETHTMIHTVYGITLGECLVRLALRESLEPLGLASASPRCVCASVNLYAEREGVVKELTIESVDGLVAFTPLAPGSCVAPPPKSFALMAWAVTKGDSTAEAIQRIQKASKSVTALIRDACLFQPYADGVENGSLAFGSMAFTA